MSTTAVPPTSPKILLKDLHSFLTCTLCGGYFIDATTLDCLHVFCRGCILKHFESATQQTCPTCNKKKTCFRPDPQVQALVYKMVPGLYAKETQRRDDFYRSTGARANSSCSDDSVLGDLQLDQEKWLSRNKDETKHYYSPDDSISLSLEYYQHHLDTTDSLSDNNNSTNNSPIEVTNDERIRDRRYLQCPAAVSMSHLQKFLRMKYALSQEHKVDIIYEGEVLPTHYNLMDVAYTFNWTKLKPMRFFYRIFTPLKVQPIKIITKSMCGGKQLQIVPVKPSNNAVVEMHPVPVVVVGVGGGGGDAAKGDDEIKEDQHQVDKNKERLMAHLKLQSRHKPVAGSGGAAAAGEEPNCVYEYEEPDKEEIKRFAENRDREWARMRDNDSNESSTTMHHGGKKRKKSKHSKGEIKKRKIHAEITSEVKEESIKLKVKLTPHNGHKHKHRGAQPTTPPPPQPPPPPVAPSIQVEEAKKTTVKVEEVVKPTPTLIPIEKKSAASSTTTNSDKKAAAAVVTTTDRKTSAADRQAQKTFLKTFQSNADTATNGKTVEKVATDTKVEKKPLNTYSNTIKALERKIATLQQQCTIEAKPEKKVSFADNKPHILNSHFPGPKPSTPPTTSLQNHVGYTVSKVENGTSKRKCMMDEKDDKRRPSLEITLINPEPKAKRPPPPTIPLERIKKSMNIIKMAGVSITPKVDSSKCDNIGALDLSKPHKAAAGGGNGITLNGIKSLNGLTKLSEKNHHPQLSNLQMLSKVASEQHSTIKNNNNNNNNNHLNINKVKPQIPNLQALKIPHVNASTAGTPPPHKTNLARMPKLNEINKMHFRLLNNAQMRNMRPSQNQNVRNIPNPSLLVRQQRLNASNCNTTTTTPSTTTTTTTTSSNNLNSEQPKILNSLMNNNNSSKENGLVSVVVNKEKKMDEGGKKVENVQ